MRSAGGIADAAPPFKPWLIERYPAWENAENWRAIRNESGRLTSFYLLSALDLEWTADGHVAPVAAENAVYLGLFGRTLWIGFTVRRYATIAFTSVSDIRLYQPNDIGGP